MANASVEKLIWIDLEMTGLDVEVDSIIEIATIVTDADGEILATGPNLAISCAEKQLASMDAWNQSTHGASGLLDRVRASSISLAEAEQQTLTFLREHVPAGVSPMCGNSICQDRRFLHREMPELCTYFHYRHLDVSTLKILASLWGDETCAHVKDHNAHLALDDILASIDEFKHYRRTLIDPKWRKQED